MKPVKIRSFGTLERVWRLPVLVLLAALVCQPAPVAQAANWYVATNGLDTNPGTQASPLATLMQAQTMAASGDTVFINAGTYYPTNTYPVENGVYVPVNLITKSGITYEALPGSRPVFNFSRVNPPGLRTAAFWVIANNVTFQGFDVVDLQENITNVNNQSVGFANWGCNFCLWNQINVHDGQCVGIYFEELDASNLVYRCDCYNLTGITNLGETVDNYTSGNSDGFGCHVSAGGTGNIFRECRSWNNSDDGYDCINCSEPVVFDHCWSYMNGNNYGNGNGFKVGGWASTDQNAIADPIPTHIVFNCFAVGNNGNAGFYANHQPAGPGAPTGWTNNTAYANVVGYNMLQRTPPDFATNVDETDANDIPGTNEAMHLNLAFGDTYLDIENLNETGSLVSSNSWTESGVSVSAADFVSLNVNQMTNARLANGALPVITLMHLVPGDPLTGLGCFVVPPTPSNLVAAVSGTQVALSWAVSPGAYGYDVYRVPASGGVYTNIALWVTNNSYTDSGLSNSTSYYYEVTAVNPGDESTNSAPVGALTAPAGPSISAVSVTPNPAFPGQVVTISATVAANPNPIASVTLNASAIGGAANQTLVSNGAGSYTNSLAIGAATAVGAASLTVNASDDLGDLATPFPFSLSIEPLTETWDGAGADNHWSDATNWAGVIAPGYDNVLIFGGAADLAPLMDTSYAEFAVTFNNSAGAFSISAGAGAALTLAGGVTNNSANLQTLNVPLILGATVAVDAAAGDLVLGQAVTNGGNLLVLTDGGHDITLAGPISGTGGLARSGAGVSTLSAANTFSGSTVITNGALQLANALALQDSAVVYNGGNLTFSGITAATFGGLSGSNNLSLLNGASAPVALTVGGNNTSAAFSGGLSGAGAAVTKAGTGLWTLSGASSYSGNTTVSAGTLQLNAGAVINGAAATVADGAALIVNGGSLTAGVSGNIGAGAVTSLLVASGSAAFNGGLTTDLSEDTAMLIEVTGGSLTAASLALGRSGFIASTQPAAGSTVDGLYVNGGAVSLAGNLDMSSSSAANSSASARIDSGSLAVGGAVTIGLNNGTRWSVLDVNGGVFTVTNTATGVSIGGPNAGNAALLIRNGVASLGRIGLGYGAVADSAVLSQTGGALYVGAGGIAQVSANVSLAVGLTNGLLGALADWTSSVPMILANLTLQAADPANAPHNISLGGVLGGGTLTKTGGGTLTLAGTNVYTGVTLVSAGKLMVNGALAAGGTVTVAAGGALGGSGVIGSPVVIQAGGILAPGAPISTFTVSNSLALASGATNIFEISHSPLTNDAVRVSGALTNGGVLIVTNIGGGALASGDTFKLFSAAAYSGAFAGVILPALPATLAWNTDSLANGGVLSVVTRPGITNVSVSIGGLVFSGVGGVAASNFYLLGSTNLALPLTNWSRLSTNQFGGGGNFNVTNAINPGALWDFYLIELP